MKKIKDICASVLLGSFLLAGNSCGDYLDIMPENSQVSDTYWKSADDVENFLMGGYYYLRSNVESYIIPWGELRASVVYKWSGAPKLQSWQMTSADSYCKWDSWYKIINIANTVLERADEACQNSDTYTEAARNSHYTEAAFLRAISYFYLVRNFRDVPMPLKAYSDDKVIINIPKVSEDTVVNQIKADLKTAIATGAAKESFETTWETKGRATKWALYALMADVCLWHEDYEECITYCDALLNASGSKVPAFMATPTRSNYMSMYNPGNSNESIFELQYNYEEDQTNNLPVLFDDQISGACYAISAEACNDFVDEYTAIVGDNEGAISNGKESARTYHSAFHPGSNVSMAPGLQRGYVWKYIGSTTEDKKRTSTYYDPNFIIYRMADIILMRAEAYLRLDGDNPTKEHKLEAVRMINKIRERAGYADENNIAGVELSSNDLEEAYSVVDQYTQEQLLEKVLDERKLEFVGEGKIWYDMLRMGRANNNKYKTQFLVEQVIRYNTSASESWLRSVLNSDNALFLPIYASEIESNDKLVQNPYYK